MVLKYKKKRCIECGNERVIFSRGRCQSCAAKTYGSLKKNKHKGLHSKKPSRRTALISKIDSAFSKYIRNFHSDEHGYVRCFTSGNRIPWKEAQAGHYVPRGNFSTRWDPMNVFPQSKYDNEDLNGNLTVYREKLVSIYGEAAVKELEYKGRRVFRYSIKDLEAKLAEVKSLSFRKKYAGMQYGMLLVTHRDPLNLHKVICECDCGQLKSIDISTIRKMENHGDTASCGCLRRSRSHLVHIWKSMENRCSEWENYFKFQIWATSNGWVDGMDVERIDSEDRYCPSNCIIITNDTIRNV